MNDQTGQDQPGTQTAELDKLLSEAQPAQQTDVLEGLRKDIQEVKAGFESDRAQKTQNDVTAAVDVMREKVPDAFKKNPMFSAEAMEDHLTRLAEKDEGFKSAFLGRHKDPAVWKKAQTEQAESFGKQFENMPDAGLTEDREAVIASSKATKPAKEEFDEKSVGTMPTEDFNKLQESLGVRPYGRG